MTTIDLLPTLFWVLRHSHQDNLPAILSEASQAQLHEHFFEEYQPVGPTELALVRMLARHAAGAERYELGGGAVGRQTARHLPELLQVSGGGRELTDASTRELADDVILTGTLGNEAVDRCERHASLAPPAVRCPP